MYEACAKDCRTSNPIYYIVFFTGFQAGFFNTIALSIGLSDSQTVTTQRNLTYNKDVVRKDG